TARFMAMIDTRSLAYDLGKRSLAALATTIAGPKHFRELFQGQAVLPLKVVLPSVYLVGLWMGFSPSLLVRIVLLLVGFTPSLVSSGALFLVGFIVDLLLSAMLLLVGLVIILVLGSNGLLLGLISSLVLNCDLLLVGFLPSFDVGRPLRLALLFPANRTRCQLELR